MKSKLLKYSFFLLLAVTIFFYYTFSRQPYQIMSGETMNTYYRIKIRSTKEDNLLHNSIKKELQRINEEMSVFDGNSEISLINRDDTGDWIELSPEMATVMKTAYNVYMQSNGYFDPTVGRLVDLWGFGTKESTQKVPDEKLIKETLKSTGFDKLRFSNNFTKVKKTNPDTKINLSAIAKGYGVDRIAALLEENGYTDYIVEIGGEVKAKGDRNKDTKGWNVAVVKPNTQTNENAYIVPLKDYAVATSGDYRNFFYYNEKRYSHTISPKTGYPVEHNLASATVFHKNCTTADALATAIMAMGEKQGLKFANDNNLFVILFVREDGNNFKPLLSNKAQKELEE